MYINSTVQPRIMSVQSSNPGDDEDEIHDLVLMFAHSKMPRGSDAFQSIMDDFLPSDENDNDSSDSTSVFSHSSKDVENDKKDHLDTVDGNVTPTARMVSPKPPPLAHVHWPDEKNRKLASSPARDQRHHARLYVKTTPAKPILKHEDDVLDHPSDSPDHRRGCKT